MPRRRSRLRRPPYAAATDDEDPMPTPLTHDDPPALGPFRLIARLGSGGMGTVYLARTTGGRTVAVKTMHAALAAEPAARTRFRLEVDAARVIGGQFGARVVDADPLAETPWLATEYVLGPALDEAVRSCGPLPERSVRALGAALCSALGQLHRSDVVHRDLKPSNVLVTAYGPKVIDFGIARAAGDDRLTRTGSAVGTPAFMSPEQATGQEHTSAGDVFALAGVLLFTATGRAPFGQGQTADLLYRVRYQEPDLSGLPPGLAPLLGSAWTRTLTAARPRPSSPDGCTTDRGSSRTTFRTSGSRRSPAGPPRCGGSRPSGFPHRSNRPRRRRRPRCRAAGCCSRAALWCSVRQPPARRPGPGAGGPPRNGRRPWRVRATVCCPGGNSTRSGRFRSPVLRTTRCPPRPSPSATWSPWWPVSAWAGSTPVRERSGGRPTRWRTPGRSRRTATASSAWWRRRDPRTTRARRAAFRSSSPTSTSSRAEPATPSPSSPSTTASSARTRCCAWPTASSTRPRAAASTGPGSRPARPGPCSPSTSARARGCGPHRCPRGPRAPTVCTSSRPVSSTTTWWLFRRRTTARCAPSSGTVAPASSDGNGFSTASPPTACGCRSRWTPATSTWAPARCGPCA
ncbi:serine/threonine-protein kinase AfsK [Streptomyces sp. e14]|nr:serine/threonine-protein kinase AfsK [Streptomyces sp. e14]